MRRCMLVQVRPSVDDKTGDKLLFLTLIKLPQKMKKGGYFYPNSKDFIVPTCINGTKNPKDYEDMLLIQPGALFDVTWSINDFNEKKFVSKLDYVKGTNNHDPEKLYL